MKTSRLILEQRRVGKVKRCRRLVLGALCVGLMAIAFAPLVASQEGIYVDDAYLDAHELDPIVVAIGATTHDATLAVHSVHADAEAKVWSAAHDHPELKELLSGTKSLEEVSDRAKSAVEDSALSVIASRLALEPVVESLYDDLSKTERASTISHRWRQCMANNGYHYNDPVEVETKIRELSRTQEFDDIVRLVESRDGCLAVVESSTERLVLESVPHWKSEHAILLSSYRDALESHGNG